jgi:hypothetical protein
MKTKNKKISRKENQKNVNMLLLVYFTLFVLVFLKLYV